MNKPCLAILVLFISAHVTGWAMLTVSKSQLRPSKKYFTQEKIEKAESRASEESQNFLNSFGQYSPNKTGLMFCDLSRKGKEKALRCLSHNQKILVWCGAQDLEVPFLSAVFNGNEKVALMYCQKPIGEILEAYASAKEMRKWHPMPHLKEQHYMALKDSQRIIISQVGHTIHCSDVPKYMAALKMLGYIDPELIDRMECITDEIKVYPSLSERARIFYGMIPQGRSLDVSMISFGGIVGGAGIGNYLIRPLIGRRSVPFDDKMIAFIGGLVLGIFPVNYGYVLTDTYPQYQDHLKTNILPNQPTLTDYLKKKSS